MPEYDFRTLSPTDFEYFVGDLLNADLGLRLHSYPEGRDQGIDLREVTADGHTTIVQCKHYLKSSPTTFLTAVRKEAGKPALRAADRYIFVTSQDLPAQREDEVARILGIPHGDVWGPRAINDALGRNPDVERRHFKLWLSSTAALEAVLHAGRWHRTDARMEEVADRAKYWVKTPAYEAVRGILDAEGVCLITGVPGAGKTFLTDMIALADARDGWRIVDVSDGIESAWTAVHPTDPSLFLCDDFLGQATLEPAVAAADLVRFIAYVRRRRDRMRLVLTSREQVLREAAAAISDPLRQLAGDTGDPARYTISLAAYDEEVRTQILLNHVHFSDLPDAERELLAIDNRVPAIARHPAYNPRIIEWLTTTRSLADATVGEVLDDILRALDNPSLVWSVSFDALSPLAQDLLLALATHPARPVPLAELRRAASPAPVPARDWSAAIALLEPTWIRQTDDEERSVAFANPGCRDFLLGRLDDPDFAEEWVPRLRTLRQLLSVTRSAGLLAVEPGGPLPASRPHLARALLYRSADLADLVERSLAAEPSAPIGTWRDAAALLTVYGTTETSARFLEGVTALLAEPGRITAADGFALAAWLHRLRTAVPVPDGLVPDLITVALANARTTRDLDGYEALPAELRTPSVHETARRRAATVIDAELAALAGDPDPDLIRDTALDLAHRADWYGLTVSISALLDQADDLDGRETK